MHVNVPPTSSGEITGERRDVERGKRSRCGLPIETQNPPLALCRADAQTHSQFNRAEGLMRAPSMHPPHAIRRGDNRPNESTDGYMIWALRTRHSERDINEEGGKAFCIFTASAHKIWKFLVCCPFSSAPFCALSPSHAYCLATARDCPPSGPYPSLSLLLFVHTIRPPRPAMQAFPFPT